MKKLIAAVVIATSAFGAQQVSANDAIDDYCLDTAIAMEKMQVYVRMSGMSKSEANRDFRNGFIEGAGGLDGVEFLMNMHLNMIDLTYENLVFAGGKNLAREVFFECKKELESMQ